MCFGNFIPLGYFEVLGLPPKLHSFKGSNFDVIATIQHVVMDKRVMSPAELSKVQEVIIKDSFDKNQLYKMVNALE